MRLFTYFITHGAQDADGIFDFRNPFSEQSRDGDPGLALSSQEA